MVDEPEIIKQLKKEEELGLLLSKSQNAFVDSEIKEDDSEEFDTEKSVHFAESDDSDEVPSVRKNTKDDLLKIKNENEQLKAELMNARERYDSLAEYFETISMSTITLNKKDLFSDVSDIIFQLSPSGKITYINSAVEKIVGYSTSEMVGCDFSKLVNKNDGGGIAVLTNTNICFAAIGDANSNGIPDDVELFGGQLAFDVIKIYNEEKIDILGQLHGKTVEKYVNQ